MRFGIGYHKPQDHEIRVGDYHAPGYADELHRLRTNRQHRFFLEAAQQVKIKPRNCVKPMLNMDSATSK